MIATAWLDDILAAYGEPKMHAGPLKRRGFDDDPAHEIEAWTWFPGNINHTVKALNHGRWWTVTVSAHRAMPNVDVRFSSEPTDEQMRALLAFVGFCSTPRCVVCDEPLRREEIDAKECGSCFQREDDAARRRAA